MPCATKWLALKGIILSEISKIQKEKHYMILYTESIIVTRTETKSRSVAARVGDREENGTTGVRCP